MPAAFRPLQPADIDRAIEMMAQLYATGDSSFNPERARQATGKLLSEPEFGGVWMIDSDGTMAGYLVLVMGYSLEFGGRFGLLDELFILPGYRGGGLGSEALAFAGRECQARGWLAMRLEVGQHNQRAQSLYRRSGFEMHDRFLMTKWM